MSAHQEIFAGYDVTRSGQVFSTTNWRGHVCRELARSLNSSGYPSVRLTVNGKRIRYAIHMLVALAHLAPKTSVTHQVRHLDGDKLNSAAENLAWGTAKENAADRERHDRTSRGIAHSKAIKRCLPTPHNKGKQLSAEQKQKISVAMKGRVWSKARRAAYVK